MEKNTKIALAVGGAAAIGIGSIILYYLLGNKSNSAPPIENLSVNVNPNPITFTEAGTNENATITVTGGVPGNTVNIYYSTTTTGGTLETTGTFDSTGTWSESAPFHTNSNGYFKFYVIAQDPASLDSGYDYVTLTLNSTSGPTGSGSGGTTLSLQTPTATVSSNLNGGGVPTSIVWQATGPATALYNIYIIGTSDSQTAVTDAETGNWASLANGNFSATGTAGGTFTYNSGITAPGTLNLTVVLLAYNGTNVTAWSTEPYTLTIVSNTGGNTGGTVQMTSTPTDITTPGILGGENIAMQVTTTGFMSSMGGPPLYIYIVGNGNSGEALGLVENQIKGTGNAATLVATIDGIDVSANGNTTNFTYLYQNHLSGMYNLTVVAYQSGNLWATAALNITLT